MSYKIVKNGDQFEIHELLSEQKISTHPSHEDATKRYRFLKKGGAFNGFTPSFFLISFKDKI